MRAPATALALALAIPLSACGAIEKAIMSDFDFSYGYARVDPAVAPQSQDVLEAWASSLAAVDVDLLEVDAGALGPAALVDALAAQGRPFRVLVERGPGGRSLLMRDDGSLEVQEVQSQPFGQQGPGDLQGFLRVRVDGPAGTRHVVSVALAADGALREGQITELLARLESLDGSVTLARLPVSLGSAQGLLVQAGYVPAGAPAAAWTRGSLAAPAVHAPLHGPDLVLTFAP